jgi:hypothetical protein
VKTYTCFGVAVLALVAIFGTSACSSPSDVAATHFIIRVDSIAVPEAVAAGDTLSARIFGRVGPDQCSRVDHVERGRGPGLLTLTFHGRRVEGGDCLHMPAVLDHVEIVAPPLEDPFAIRINQPEGSVLERVVRVQ